MWVGARDGVINGIEFDNFKFAKFDFGFLFFGIEKMEEKKQHIL
jgi:hypothetical protein